MATTAHGLLITRTCPACGSTNHIPVEQFSPAYGCRVCREWRSAEPIAVDETAFAAIARQAHRPIIIAFCAGRSAACRRIAPDIHELAGEMAGRAIFLKVDAEQHPQLGYDFGVCALPHLLLWRAGEVLSERCGAISKAELRRWLCAYVDEDLEHPLCQSAFARLTSRVLRRAALFTGLLSSVRLRRAQA